MTASRENSTQEPTRIRTLCSVLSGHNLCTLDVDQDAPTGPCGLPLLHTTASASTSTPSSMTGCRPPVLGQPQLKGVAPRRPAPPPLPATGKESQTRGTPSQSMHVGSLGILQRGDPNSSSSPLATRPSSMGITGQSTDTQVTPLALEDSGSWGDWGGSSQEGSPRGDGVVVQPRGAVKVVQVTQVPLVAMPGTHPALGSLPAEVAPKPEEELPSLFPQFLCESRCVEVGAVRTREGSPPKVFFDPE